MQIKPSVMTYSSSYPCKFSYYNLSFLRNTAAFAISCALLLVSAGSTAHAVVGEQKQPTHEWLDQNNNWDQNTDSKDQYHNARIVVAQNTHIDEGCQKKTLINIKKGDADRSYCKQGRIDKKTKFEHSLFTNVVESNDELNIYHMKLLKKNWYFGSQESTVLDSLPKIFKNLENANFDGGDQKIGLGGSYVFVPFELDNKSCFGFRKNRREKLTRGYYCREGDEPFTATTVKPIVKRFQFL